MYASGMPIKPILLNWNGCKNNFIYSFLIRNYSTSSVFLMSWTNIICKYWWLCTIPVFFYACQIDHSNHIPRQVQPYLAAFVNEGKQRRISIEVNSLTIAFVDSLKDEEGNPVNAQYIRSYFPLKRHRIELDTTKSWWRHTNHPLIEYSATSAREKVIFHELAHCFLNRAHKFDTLPSGVPASIMGITVLPTYELNNKYRRYYLDELFNPDTPSLCWSTNENCED